MRTVPFEFNGRTFHLLLNGAALFDIYDQFGQEGSVLDPLKDRGREGFEAVCWYLAKLAGQGELYRRWLGYESGPIPEEDAFRVALSPLDVPRARNALTEAIGLGFLREEEAEKKEIDLGLLELEKKTGGS